MRLRPAKEIDIPGIVTLVNQAYRGVGRESSWNVESGIIEGQRITESTLRHDLAAKPHAHLLVSHDESNQPAACVWLEPQQSGVWYLGMFAVSPHLQKQQLGRQLLAAAEDFARDHGARQIRMSVLNVRDSLIAWYQRRGYELTSETEPFPYGDERFGRPLRQDLHFVILVRTL